MQSAKLSLRLWFLAMFLIGQSKNTIAALELKRHLGVCYKTAWSLKHKLMEAMSHREQKRTLCNRVEVDDAYLGGERAGKRGRGSPNKVPFIAAVQTNERGHPLYLRLDRVHTFDNETGRRWANQALASGTQLLVSDGLSCFAAAARELKGIEHEVHLSGGGRAGAQTPELRWVNTLLGNLKTSLSGTLHAFNYAKYAERYLAEFQFRFNRRFDLGKILPAMVGATAGAPHVTASRLRVSEDCH